MRLKTHKKSNFRGKTKCLQVLAIHRGYTLHLTSSILAHRTDIFRYCLNIVFSFVYHFETTKFSKKSNADFSGKHLEKGWSDSAVEDLFYNWKWHSLDMDQITDGCGGRFQLDMIRKTYFQVV